MNIIASFSSFASGIVTGGAFAALISLLNLLPRMVNMTESNEQLPMYENLYIIGGFLFSIAYFLNFYMSTHVIVVIILGLIYGIYLGAFNAALAETLNVLPIIAKKFKFKKEMTIIFYFLVLGKVLGSIYYFIFY